MSVTVHRSDFRMEILSDAIPDASYLYQEGWEERKAQYERGAFNFVGVRAVIAIPLPDNDGCTTTVYITSSGLWGIESDSGEQYFADVFNEECGELCKTLTALGVTVVD